MALSTCPHCKKTLKVPDDSTPRALRCPLCKKIFEHTGPGGDGRQTLDGRRSAFSVALSKSGDAPAGANGSRVGTTATLSTGATTTILSDADEAMLREFGSGSGLLELTREAYVNGNPGDVNVQVAPPPNAPRHAVAVSPVPPSTAPPPTTAAPSQSPAAPSPSQPQQPATTGGQADMSAPELERQFTVVSMALTMANKLVLAHKAELTNVRSNQRLAWTVVVVLILVFLGTAWWGMDLRGQAALSNRDYESAKESFKGVEASSAALRLEVTAKNAELDQAKSQLVAEQNQSATLLTRIATAEGQMKTLDTDLKRAKAEVEQAKIAQERAEREAEGLAKDNKALRAELAAKTKPAPPAVLQTE